MALLSISRARSILNWDPERDTTLTSLLQGVQADFERLTSRTLERVVDRVYDHRLGKSQYFRTSVYPLESLALVDWPLDMAVRPAFNNPDYVLDADSYDADLSTGEVRLRGYFDRVSSRLTGGWTSLTVPPDIALALESQLQFSVARNSPIAVASKSASTARGVNTSLEDTRYHPVFQEIALRYKRYTF